MKHSNICYILNRNPETKKLQFVEVNGISVKNSYGFDLFRHKPVNGGKYFTVTEGQTGLRVCETTWWNAVTRGLIIALCSLLL